MNIESLARVTTSTTTFININYQEDHSWSVEVNMTDAHYEKTSHHTVRLYSSIQSHAMCRPPHPIQLED